MKKCFYKLLQSFTNFMEKLARIRPIYQYPWKELKLFSKCVNFVEMSSMPKEAQPNVVLIRVPNDYINNKNGRIIYKMQRNLLRIETL